MRLAYAQGFRAPSIRELYFSFFDASHAIEGNPNLEAELSHSFNASWNWYVARTPSFSYTSIVSGFYNSIDNMIDYGVKPGNSAITTYINVDKYKTQGVTWNNTVQLGNASLTAGAGYTGRYNRFSSQGEDLLDFTWSPEVNGSVNYDFPKIDMNVSLFYKYTGTTPFYELTATNPAIIHLAKTGSYHWADVTVQKTFLKHVNVNVGIRNLFDVTQVQSTSQISSTHSGNASKAVGSGRSFFTALLINF
jgi:outer membrane receptor for ferrienterochelin and colicins